MQAQVVILDFGSQYTQLIARAVREQGVYCEILPGTAAADKVLSRNPKALILSGGPSSVLAADGLFADKQILEAKLPMFGICYGMQILAKHFGGVVTGWGRAAHAADEAQTGADESGIREFGRAEVSLASAEGPFKALGGQKTFTAWMSHGDKITQNPPGFRTIATSEGAPICAFGDEARKIYGVQFHVEVHHTPQGKEILKSFLFDVAKLEKDWNPAQFADTVIADVRAKAPQGNVVCGLSGGVDSTVAAVLVHKAIGSRLHCIFVDNGLLREGERDDVEKFLKPLGLNLHIVDASRRFLDELKGVTNPEQKRKIIGRVFIDVFEEEAQRIEAVEYLVQGTLYPDVIESVSVVGQSVTIKSHHNVGGLKDVMKLKLIEPLRELFKDEVRVIGRGLKIPDKIIDRQPFPGPGLAVRCLGEITDDKLVRLRRADSIVREEVERADLATVIWQSFAVLLPIQSVGVMGDGRTYEQTIAVRAVTSVDGMTADWYMFPEEVLRRMASRIINETPGVNRVVLDISTKPPSTIEWE